MVYASFVPKKGDMDGNQVRLLSCGFLPTSSPCAGVFLGFPGRFCPSPGFLCLLVFVGIQRTSGQDASPTVLNSGFVHTLPKEQASTVQKILFRGVMTPSLLPVRPGLHSMDVGLL